MPVLDNTQSDDQLLFEVEASFDGGTDSRNLPRLLGQGQCAEMINIDTAVDGTAVTRRGTAIWGSSFSGSPAGTYPITGMGFYNTNERTDLIVARNGYLYVKSTTEANVAWTRINYESTNFAFSNNVQPVYFTMLEGKMFFSNGTGVLKWIEPLAGTASGLVIKDCPQQVFGVSPNTTTLPAPSNLIFLTTHLGRIFAVDNTYPDTIRVSSVLSASGTMSWNSVDSLTLSGLKGISDGDAITGIASWTGTRLVVFKRHSTFVVDCDGDTTYWSVQNIDENVGCASHRSIARVGSDVFWLSDAGVRTLVRTLAGTENQISEPLSKPIQPLIGDIYKASIESASAIFFENRYILSLPSKPDASSRFSIVYNTLTRNWTGKWIGMDGLCHVRYTNEFIDSIFIGMPNGTVMRWLGGQSESNEYYNSYYDATVPVYASLTTREYSFGDYVTKKSPFSFEVEFLESSSVADVYLIMDGGSKVAVVTAATAASGIAIPFILDSTSRLGTSNYKRIGFTLIGKPQFKGIQFYVAARGSSPKMGLISLAISAYKDNYIPVQS
jgi:hypothetical protein